MTELSSLARLTRSVGSAPVSAFVSVAFALLVGACSSSSEVGGENPGAEPGVDEGEVASTCTNPRRYFVTFREGSGTCEPIAGKRGRWLPERLFADAPEDVQSSTCAYIWSGARYSRPDRDALIAKVGYANAAAPACGSSSFPDVGELQPIPNIDDIWGHAGSVGCDVCGVLRNGKIWVILPPERVAKRQFEVVLSTGETRAFQINATDARALAIDLPPAPAGTRYRQGRVHVY